MKPGTPECLTCSEPLTAADPHPNFCSSDCQEKFADDVIDALEKIYLGFVHHRLTIKGAQKIAREALRGIR